MITNRPLPAPIAVDEAMAGMTLAAALKKSDPKLTWSAARSLIDRGMVTVNQVPALDSTQRLSAGDAIQIHNQPQAKGHAAAPDLDVKVLFKDADLVVVMKPAGVISAPLAKYSYEAQAPGPKDLTLVELASRALARMEHRPLRECRLHVVQRLDRDTSGIMVIARNKEAERALGEQLKKHSMEREYLALVYGRVTAQRFDSTLVPDRGDGKRGIGSRIAPNGQRAITHVQALATWSQGGQDYSLVACQLETGRTHQIRIHLAEAGHRLCGEKIYGAPLYGSLPPDPSQANRVMLHATHLGFRHPRTDDWGSFTEAPPADFMNLIEDLGGADAADFLRGRN